jgi:hypothetical protein
VRPVQGYLKVVSLVPLQPICSPLKTWPLLLTISLERGCVRQAVRRSGSHRQPSFRLMNALGSILRAR